MINFKTFFIFIIIFCLNLIIADIVSSQERKNPFKNWFPIIREEINETVIEIEEEPIIFFEEVEEKRYFNASMYRVDGLIWGVYKPRAIINDEIYGIGDKLGEAEITKINKEGITLIFDEDEYVITTKNTINIMEKENQGVDDEF